MSTLPLAGLKVCILTATDVVNDGRVRKEARTLAAAGATVTVVGQGGAVSERLANEPYRVVLAPKSVAGRLAKTGLASLLRRVVNRLMRVARRLFGMPHPAVTALFEMPKMSAIVREIAPDVVHCHNVYTLTAGMAAADAVGAKLIYDARELYDGYFMAAENLAAEKQARADAIEAAGLKRADAILTVSPLIGEILSTRTGRADVTVMFNALPFEDTTVGPVHTPVRILNQGAFRANTADHLIVEAMVHLRDLATLTMQGRFQREEYRQRVVTFIEEHDLADVVELVGEYDPLESIALASGYDVGVSVSQFDTPNKAVTLSNRFFTYLNAGVALAMPNVPAHADFPAFDTFGVLLNTTSAESLAESLRPLLEDPARIASLKAAARAAAPSYSWEQQERHLLAVYEKLRG